MATAPEATNIDAFLFFSLLLEGGNQLLCEKIHCGMYTVASLNFDVNQRPTRPRKCHALLSRAVVGSQTIVWVRSSHERLAVFADRCNIFIFFLIHCYPVLRRWHPATIYRRPLYHFLFFFSLHCSPGAPSSDDIPAKSSTSRRTCHGIARRRKARWEEDDQGPGCR